MTSDNVEEISSYIQTEDKIKRKRKAKILFIIYTILLFAFAIAIAASVNDIEDVFNVVGAIASNAISFIFPPMFYLLLIRKKEKPRKIHYYISWVLFVFFIPFGIFSVITKFLKHDNEA
jgi:amino acid permease